jgi:hypothetical protein
MAAQDRCGVDEALAEFPDDAGELHCLHSEPDRSASPGEQRANRFK